MVGVKPHQLKRMGCMADLVGATRENIRDANAARAIAQAEAAAAIMTKLDDIMDKIEDILDKVDV
jgi:hypothetical protein